MKAKMTKFKTIRQILYFFVAIITVFGLVPAPSQAAINTYYNTLESSSPGASSITYTFHFKPSVTTKIEYVKIQFCANAGTYGTSCTAITESSYTMAFSNSSSTLSGFGSGSTMGTPTFNGTTNELEVPITGSGTETVGTDHILTMQNWTNPDAQILFARLATYSDDGTTMIDDGSIGMAIIANVTISGTQRETLNVTVTGNTTVASPNPACDVALAGDIDTTATATTVPFGDFDAPSASKIGSQRIEVDTNASGGYTITGLTNQLMTSGGSDTIPGPTATTWVENTTYGFGICGDGARTHSKQWDNPTTVVNLTSYSDPVDNDYTYVYFRVALQGTQPAGTYTTTLNYVVTPTY